MPSDSHWPVKIGFRKLAFVPLLAVLMSVSASSSASEIRRVKDFGNWSLFCSSEIKDADDCAIAQETVDRSINRPVKVTFAFEQQGNVRMRVSTGPIVGEKRVGLLLDGVQSGLIDAKDCSSDKCVATAKLSDQYLTEVLEAKALGFETHFSEEEGSIATLSTASLDDAFWAMHSAITANMALGARDHFSALNRPVPMMLAKATIPAKREEMERSAARLDTADLSLTMLAPTSTLVSLAAARSNCAQRSTNQTLPMFAEARTLRKYNGKENRRVFGWRPLYGSSDCSSSLNLKESEVIRRKVSRRQRKKLSISAEEKPPATR